MPTLEWVVQSDPNVLGGWQPRVVPADNGRPSALRSWSRNAKTSAFVRSGSLPGYAPAASTEAQCSREVPSPSSLVVGRVPGIGCDRQIAIAQRTPPPRAA
jgi:hypothetical protein